MKGLSVTMTKQQAEILEKTMTEDAPEGKKQARAYPTSSSPSTTQDEEKQIIHAVNALKDLMEDKKKMTLVDANALVMAKIAERNHGTKNATGSTDTKILLAAVQRLYEAGVE